ncbi:MAG TPA: TIGR04076 family protein [Ignavibacteria bacterium]
MKKCKITVLKRNLNIELAEIYCKNEVTPCPFFQEGQEFIADFEPPENFCGWAWNDIYKVIVTMLSGGNYSEGYFDGWMKDKNCMIVCCTDGIRPVTFKIELIEE